jgi:thiamine-phosphate pyrophosphorylase
MKPFSECRLYAFVEAAYLHGRSPTDVARQLCDGGADVLQLRAKSASPSEIQRTAEAIRPILDAAGVGLVINDHLPIALATGAFACHLGQEDFFEAGHTRVAAIVPPGSPLQIGLSTHAPAQAARAVAAGPAYVAIGPVYPTLTKPGAAAVTLDYVRWAAAHLTIPWFAIGGITLDNLDDVLAAGARRVCVVSAILDAPDPVKACQAFRNRLTSVPR